jgi:hypothetical protein
MMKRLLALMAVVMLVSGCICCGGKDISDIMPGKKTTDDSGGDDGSETGGSDDQNDDETDDSGGGIDYSGESDNQGETETTQTTLPQQDVTQTTLAQDEATLTTATQPSVTASTQPPGRTAATYQCVSGLGMDPNLVYYAYSPNCGSKFLSDASMISIRTGVDIKPINIAVSTEEPAIKLLECFFGPYSDGNPNFKSCPQLLCPKTGQQKILSGLGQSTVSSQMSGFAKNCN